MNKKIFMTLAILFVSGVLFSLFVFFVDNALTCTPTANLQTYQELFDEGLRYSEIGQTRGFLSFYTIQSLKEKECYELAVQNFSHAALLQPDSVAVFASRAPNYLSLKQYNEAIKDYETVLHLNPENNFALLGIALAYEKSGQLPLAIATYEKAIAQMEQSEYWKQLHPEQVLEYREKLAGLREQTAATAP